MQRQIISFFVPVLFFVGITNGQTAASTSVTADARNAANEAYQKKDWKAAATGYETIVKAEGKNAGALYRLGVALINLDRAKEATVHLDAAMAISPNPVFALALARAHARNGEKDKMYAVLERSLTLGGIPSESLTGENDFAPVKGETKFVEYVKKLDGVANPCRARPEF